MSYFILFHTVQFILMNFDTKEMSTLYIFCFYIKCCLCPGHFLYTKQIYTFIEMYGINWKRISNEKKMLFEATYSYYRSHEQKIVKIITPPPLVCFIWVFLRARFNFYFLNGQGISSYPRPPPALTRRAAGRNGQFNPYQVGTYI